MVRLGRVGCCRNPARAVVEERKQAAVDVRVSTSSRHKFKRAVFYAGSCLVEPFCASRRCVYEICVVDQMHPHAPPGKNFVRKVALGVGVVAYGALGVVTTLPGIGLRALSAKIEKKSYIHTQNSNPVKPIPQDREISLLSWNICAVGAGYSITDGGISVPSSRMGALADAIEGTNADVVCLYEVFDVVTARALEKKLKKKGYTDCYYNIGPRGLGVSSGLFVAARVEIGAPEFVPFDKSTLVGRTKNSNKGVFSFSILDKDKPVARIHTTHLQHSEVLKDVQPKESGGRAAQIKVMNDIAERTPDIPTIMTGDFNMEPSELKKQKALKKFTQGDVTEINGTKTWGGDAWCAKLVGKPPTEPQTLDYTLCNKPIKTKIPFDVKYDHSQFKREALSDHKPLLSKFIV